MQIQLVRSATLRLSIGGATFLIDPWLAPRGGGRSYAGTRRSPLVELPMPAAEVVAAIDAVLVSHLHSDHFDEAARAVLPKDVPIVCHARDADALAGFGFTDVRATATELRIGAVTIAVTAGRHGPDTVLPEMGEVSGFVVRAPGEPVVYWVGDSILCDEVRTTIATERPEVIVVHACGAVWGGIGPLVMDEAMVRETLAAAPSAVVVATHLDAVDHATVTRTDLARAFAADAGLRNRLRIPADGEMLTHDLPSCRSEAMSQPTALS